MSTEPSLHLQAEAETLLENVLQHPEREGCPIYVVQIARTKFFSLFPSPEYFNELEQSANLVVSVAKAHEYRRYAAQILNSLNAKDSSTAYRELGGSLLRKWRTGK